MRITVKEFFNSHSIDFHKNGHVMCVEDGYAPQFDKGKFYEVKNGVLKSGFSFNLSSVDDQVFHRLFIPLQGDPNNLTLRDRLLIKIRYDVQY